MDFTYQRGIRFLGAMVILISLFLRNWNGVVVGWTIAIVGYLWSYAKVERELEKTEEED